MTKAELLQKAKPIIFDTESVRAILDGRKTVARQVIKNASPKWTFDCLSDDAAMTVIDRNGNEKPKKVAGLWATFNAPDEYIEFPMIKSKYQAGDILYVRETFLPFQSGCKHIYYYKSDNKHLELDRLGLKFKWHPSIHMPKEAARIFLEVTDVRVERLQDISVQDAKNEGIRVHANGCIDGLAFGCYNGDECVYNRCRRPVELFSELWNSTVKQGDIKTYGWEANPWVWVYEFERV